MFDNLHEMLKKYVGCGLNFKNRFRVRESMLKLRKKVVGLLDILIIYVLILLMHLYITCSNYWEN